MNIKDLSNKIENPNYKKWKRLLIYSLLSGIVFLFIGLFVFGSIPYQDPPPELIKKQNFDNTISNILCCSGLALIIISIVLLVVNKIIKK